MTDTTASLKKKLILTTVFVGAFVGYGGRRAYAATCTGGSNTYVCAGSSAVTEFLTKADANITVSTDPGFSIASNYGGAMYISASTVSFTDTNHSTINTTDGTGINIQSGYTDGLVGGGSLTMNINSTVTGVGNGIEAEVRDTGSLSITSAGDVTATGGIGIRAQTSNASTDLTITLDPGSSVSGTTYGVQATSKGSGNLSITANGDIDASTGRAIYALNATATTSDITITMGADTKITGGTDGVVTKNLGTGGTTITADGEINVDHFGIFAKNQNNTTDDLIITTGVGSSIVGGQRGIHAFNYGTGATTITAHGDVEGTTFSGITAYNHGDTALTVTTDAGTSIIAERHGIRAVNYGAGALTLTANGTVTGTDNNGLYARGYGPSMLITAGEDSVITGGDTGIMTFNYGDGDLTINANGVITGTNDYGIYAYNVSSAKAIIITTGVGSSVVGGFKGIYAKNDGTGETEITVHGDVEGTTSMGIDAKTTGTGDLAITTDAGTTVTGNINGIRANSQGHLTVTANGVVTATDRAGISALGHGPSVDVTTGEDSNVTGGWYGVLGRNYGDGALTISINGDVTATGNTSYGVYAAGYSDGTNVTITTGENSTIEGKTAGIKVIQKGTGNTTITIQGQVDALGGKGVYARNYGNTVDLTITATADSDIEATGVGIAAYNNGDGATSITVNGDLTSSSDNAMVVRSYADTTTLDIKTGANSNVVGNDRGIRAFHYGSGDMTVTTNGDIEGTTGYGMSLYNKSTTTALIVNANANVVGADAAIFAGAYGTGLTITTGASSKLTGVDYGIIAYNSGVGASTITINGEVEATDNAGVAISAYNDNGTTNINITTAAGSKVTGGAKGILAENNGTGFVTVSNSGAITGDIGILVDDGGDTAGSITNTSTGKIEGKGGTAISLTNLDAAMEIKINGGQIIGDVVDDTPGNGFSTVTIGGSFTSAGDFDVSDFNVSSGKTFTFGAGDKITSDSTVDVDGIMTVSAAGSSIVGAIDVNSGGKLNVGAAFAVSDELTNAGTVAIAAGKTLTIDTMGTATGTLDFGVGGAANHAQLTINSGAADLTGQTITINVPGTNTLTAGTYIKLIDGTTAIVGGPGATATTVTDNSALWNFKIVDGTVGGTNNTDLFVTASLSDAVNSPAGNALIEAAGTTTDPDLLDIIDAMNSASSEEELANIVASTQPTVNGGTTTTILSTSSEVRAIEEKRIASIRAGDEDTGMAAGVAGNGMSLWVQGFGQVAKQNRRNGDEGYKSDTFGGAAGFDTTGVIGDGVLGIAFSYGKANVNAKNVTTTGTDIGSYGVSLYSNYRLDGTKAFLNMQLGYGYNDISNDRHDAGGLGVTAHADYGSDQAAAKVSLGYDYVTPGLILITPSISTTYTYLSTDAYTETGAGGANLSVESDRSQTLNLGFDVNASWRLVSFEDNKVLKPALRVGYAYDAIGDAIATTATFTGGGPAFTTRGPAPARTTLNAGGGLTYLSGADWSLSVNYNYEHKDAFSAHSGTLRSTVSF